MATDSPNPDDPNDPNNPDAQGGSGGGSSQPECGSGTFHIDIDASGHPKPAPDGECVDQAEASRRNKLWIQQNPGNPGETEGGPKSTTPSGPQPPAYPKYNFGTLPQFAGLPDFVGPEFKAPTFEEAMNDPGYKFAVDEGRRSREASAASLGKLRTGGTLRSLEDYGQKMGAQQYQNVYGRKFGEFNTDYAHKFGEYGLKYRQALDQYSPNLTDYLLKANAEIGAKNLGYTTQNSNFWKQNMSIQDLLALLGGI